MLEEIPKMKERNKQDEKNLKIKRKKKKEKMKLQKKEERRLGKRKYTTKCKDKKK